MHGEARAHALFETPATLACVLNLVLLPGLVVASLGARNRLLIMLVVILSAGLAAAVSRGGWIAFASAVLIALIFAGRLRIRVDRNALAVLSGCLGAGWLICWLAPLTLDSVLAVLQTGGIHVNRQEYSMFSEGAILSSIDRLGMYELALKSLAAPALFSGFGYLGFFYLVQAGGGAVPGIQPGITYFVHNDYLQALLELGVPGLAMLLAVVVLPLAGAWRALPRIAGDRLKSQLVVALVASLSSMAIHAVVDFPFYIPVCLLMYGTLLGLADRLLEHPPGTETEPPNDEPNRLHRWRSAGVAGAATLVVWVLAMPVAAETAAGYAHRQWSSAQGESAAYWFEVARRLEPRDWRYHWYMGQFWLAQAVQNRKPEAARLADQAFSDGIAANPREVQNLLGRITIHRALRTVVPAPAEGRTVVEWSERAIKLAPENSLARMERALVLKELDSSGREVPKWAK
jgi:hypothetical protein